MPPGRNRRGTSSPTMTRSHAGTAPPTPALDTTPVKAAIKDTMKVDTNVPIVGVDPQLLDRLSPSVRDVAQHAALLKSVLARLGPIYDLVEREATRMTDVSPFLAGRDQVGRTRVLGVFDINLLYRPAGPSERSLDRRCAETRREGSSHQEID